MNPQSTQDSADGASDADATKPTRKPWVAPQLTAHGSFKHLVRGATGHFGDQATPFGKRHTP